MSTRNKLSDLNNHLFEQLERLNDDELMAERGEEEIARSKAIAGISKSIVENGRLAFEAHKHSVEFGYNANKEMPHLLGSSDEEE